MKKYNCLSCDYHTNLKGDYTRHLQTKKHEKLVQISPKLVQISPKSKIYECKYCTKIFKHQSSLCKHIKYTCKKNKDEDFQELARLLNEKDKQLVLKDKQMDKQLALKEAEMKRMQKQIDELTNKLQLIK